MSESGVTAAVTRRGFIGAASVAGATLAVGLPSGAIAAAAAPTDAVFQHAVASGDPLPDRVIIWTRLTPSPEAVPGSQLGSPSGVTWEVSATPQFTDIAASGSTTTDATHDHTVKIDVPGLTPATTYWYRFRVTSGPAAGAISAAGRTKTAPAADADVSKIRFGVASCSNWEAGYFAAYRYLATRTDIQAIIHLGDYIYEYGAGEYGGKHGPVRTHQPTNQIISLADYRIRHGQYKSDPDLQAAHVQHPFVCTWDDHDAADNQWSEGSKNHTASDGLWSERKAHANQAYYEWIPVRPQVSDDDRHIYRRFTYGNLLELSMLDLRTYRDKQSSRWSSRVDEPDRTITGSRQMQWVKNGITSSTTTWQIVGNPVMISPVLLPPLDPAFTDAITGLLHIPLPQHGITANTDQWDGYTTDRDRLLTAIDDADKTNVVFITGDIHTSWANDVPREPANYPGAGTVATEFVIPSVTSNNFDDKLKVPEHTAGQIVCAAISATNNHVRWVDMDAHGYAVMTITKAAAHMDWHFLNNRADPHTGHYHAQSWRVENGSRRVTRTPHPG